MYIARFVQEASEVSSVPNRYVIRQDEFEQFMKKNSTLFEMKKGFVFESYICTEKNTDLKFRLYDGRIQIYFGQRLNDRELVIIDFVASSLNSMILLSVNTMYPSNKIIAAQKRLAKKSKAPEVEYQKESFGGNNMWLAIRSSLEEVKAFYNLKGEEKPWAEALANMHACKGMFMYEFKGWTFIAGQKTDLLFDCQVKGEEAIEKCHVDKLLEWGKTFNDVQLFMHYNRSMYFNAFYRVLNGEMIYGEYETESYQKKYGKIPKNVQDLPDSNANTVALEWSYDPDYLRFQKELENAKAWVVNVKEDA